MREREDERGVKKSKGYGFITFKDPSKADDAIQAMHQSVSSFIFIFNSN